MYHDSTALSISYCVLYALLKECSLASLYRSKLTSCQIQTCVCRLVSCCRYDKKVFLPTMGSSSQKWSILSAAPLRLLCSLSTAHPRFLGYKASPGDLGHIGPWSPAMPSPAKTQMENDPNNPRDFFNRKILCLIILQLYNTCLNLVSDSCYNMFPTKQSHWYSLPEMHTNRKPRAWGFFEIMLERIVIVKL